VTGGESEGDEGARVGEDAPDDGRVEGSNSRSGINGNTSGRRVRRRRKRRKNALDNVSS
jgi:hypothetical protein